MSRDIELLTDPFRGLIKHLIPRLAAQRGFEFKVTFTIRTPLAQGKLWRQGRRRAQIDRTIDGLRDQGCKYLAGCIEDAGPQDGPLVTNAIPGLSWHQYGEACDFAAFAAGAQIRDGDHQAYDFLARMAGELGLTTGRGWGDAGHVQYSRRTKPQHDLPTIDKLMKQRFRGE